MSSSHFPQYEHELFWRYYDRLHAFLTHDDFYLEKWKILNTVYEGVNCETRTLLEYWDFCAKNVDEAWEVIYPMHIFVKICHFCIVSLFGFGEASTILISLNLLYSDY